MNKEKITDYFVDVKSLVPDIVVDLAYAKDENFVGCVIDGYQTNIAYLTHDAAMALAQVQTRLSHWGLGLKVWDAYRPQRAVNHFIRWAEDDSDEKNKQRYYPNLSKQEIFDQGYIMKRSAHSRGSTVDLTIIELNTERSLDMGANFDFFGPISWPHTPLVSAQQKSNRLLLHNLMIQAGFLSYSKEWWHFTLSNEPFSDLYFNFKIK